MPNPACLRSGVSVVPDDSPFEGHLPLFFSSVSSDEGPLIYLLVPHGI